MKKNFGTDKKPILARAYIRVSHQGSRGKGDGKGEFLSPDLQMGKARDYVKLHLPNCAFDEEASRANMDIDRSASRLKWEKREGLVAHLEAARRGEFDALVFFKLSRFARNAREGLQLFDEFEKAGCSVISVMDNIDTTTSVGKLVRTVLLAIAEMESDNISDWVREAFLKRVENGLVHGRTYFWLTKNADDEFVLNDRANDMRRLVDLRLAGQSNVQIARQLNSEGFCSPVGLKWTSERVRLYLLPDKLKSLQGQFVYGHDKEDGDPRRIIVDKAFPAVITAEEAEAILAYNRQQREIWVTGNPRKAARTTYILSGLIRCSQCGGRFRSRTCGRPYKASYVCKEAPTNGVEHPIGVSVSAEMLEDAVLRVVREAIYDYQEQMKSGFTFRPQVTPAASSIEKQIIKVTESVSRLSALYESGHMDLEDFDRRYRELTEEREKLRTKLNEVDSGNAVLLAVEQVVSDPNNLDQTTENARRLILAFVESIEVPVEAEIPQVKGKPRKCRAAWVTLKMPLLDGTRRILAPLYDPRNKEERVLLDRE